MTSELQLLRFPDAPATAEALALVVAERLREGLAQRGRASLVIPGGSTPGRVFDRLAQAELDWSRVHVTLNDERWVAPDDPASNEHLVRSRLQIGRAAAARLVGLKTAHASPEDAVGEVERRLAAVARPFDVMLLGMGEDGHTASLFPGSAGLKASLDGDGAEVQAVQAPGARGSAARITLALPALLDARFTALLISGEAKLATLARAQAGEDALELPIRAILRRARSPVHVYWSA